MTLYDFFEQLESTLPGRAVADSIWLFPVVEAAHLLGLAALGGSILIVDLRLFGVGLRDRSAAYVLSQARPWLVGSIAIMFATGIPLLMSEAVKCYWNDAFWVKMGALSLALLFTFGLRNRLVDRRPDLRPWQMKSLAACSISLWLTVAAAGRWIGFS